MVASQGAKWKKSVSYYQRLLNTLEFLGESRRVDDRLGLGGREPEGSLALRGLMRKMSST